MDNRITTMIAQQGMLNVPLLHNQEAGEGHYALLNGERNNLCLDCFAKESSEWYRMMAWSSGNNTYIGFDDRNCHIFRFDRPQVESYEKGIVFNNSEKFFKYLNKSSYKLENSIVPFVLRAYRQLRNEIRTDNSGSDSLKALLYLLAYSRDGDGLNIGEWGLCDKDVEIIRTIDDSKWNMIVEGFTKGILFSDKWLRPDIDLILRHTSGKLFEEANYLACLPEQMSLFPDEKIRYSSKAMQDGAYFTPSYVARSIVEESLRHIDFEKKTGLTIFDPACGAGGFLVEALRQLKKASFKKPIHVIGWDKATTAVTMSRFVLNFEKQEWGDQLICEVVQCDSLATNVWPQSVDILLMNPPFMSWDLIDKPETRNYVRDIIPEVPKANMAAAFLAKAIDSVAENGVLGAVVPTRLLNDQNYRQLRSRIIDSLELKLIGGLGSYVFNSVLAYTSMLVATKGGGNYEPTTVLWTNNIAGTAGEGLKALRKHRYTNAIIDGDDYSVYEKSISNDDKSWRIDNHKNIELKLQFDKTLRGEMMRTVGDLFDIQQGARTGANDVFIVSEEFVLSLPENERYYFRPSVDNMAIDAGHLYRVNYIFYPYTKGLEPIEDEGKLQQLLPETYRLLLLPAKKKLSERKSMKDNPRWWDLTRHRNYLEEKNPKMVSTEFGHSGSFAIDYDGEYVVERGYIWNLNKQIFKQGLKFEESYLAFFASEYTNILLDLYGEKLAGADVYKLGMSDVKNMPLPDLSLEPYERFIPRLRYFAQLMKNDTYWDKAELDALVNEMMAYVK